MKSILYDSEGDILTVVFVENNDQPTRGVKLSDNVVLYYDVKTKQPIQLILISYLAMLETSTRKPLQLNGLQKMPASVRNSILRIIRVPPVSHFLGVVETRPRRAPTSYPMNVLTSTALKAVA